MAAAIKHGVDKGKKVESDSDYVAREEEDSSGSADHSDSSTPFEDDLGAEVGFKGATRPKRTAAKKVSSHTRQWTWFFRSSCL